MGKQTKKKSNKKKKNTAKKTGSAKAWGENMQVILEEARELYNGGWLQEAETKFRKCLQKDKGHAEALHKLGIIAYQKGDYSAAKDWLEKSLSVQADNLDAWINMGEASAALKDYESGIYCFRKSLELAPQNMNVLARLGDLLYCSMHLQEAIQCYTEVVQCQGNSVEILNQLGNTYALLEDYEQAREFYEQALELIPQKEILNQKSNLAHTYSNLGIVLTKKGYLQEAEEHYRRSLELYPDFAEVYNNLGMTLKATGRLEDAKEKFEQALNIRPDYEGAQHNLLLTLNYLPRISSLYLRQVHEQWGDKVAAQYSPLVQKNVVKSRSPEKPLRIGFVSGDFRLHPVGFFLAKLFQHRNPQILSFYCYFHRSVHDEVTRMFKQLSDVWVDSCAWEDELLIQRIMEDEIDVLFDLSGHTENNRLSVFARRPAPVQITWAGYVGTTGLPTMDYLLADDVHVPSGQENVYREEVLRMPEGFGYVSYTPPDYAPQVGPLPAKTNGYVTFAAFQNPAKINDYFLELWARILKNVPESRLLLRYSGMDADFNVSRIKNSLQQYGIDPQRVFCKGVLPHLEFLASYNQVDITLDTHPYSGGLSTCESLWMGVPVITLPGDTFASRHSASHLTRVGLEDLIVGGEEEYVALAVELANDLSRLDELRSSLRERMRRAPLFDGENWTRAFETLVLQAVYGSKHSRSSTEEILEKAIFYHSHGKLGPAETMYQAVLEAEPEQAIALHNLGVLSAAQGCPENAVGYFEKALQKNPDFPEVCMNLANTLKDMGRLNEAREYYNRALRIRPQSCEAYNSLGVLLENMGEFQESGNCYQMAVQICPDFVQAWNNWGNVLQYLERLQEAEEKFKKALQKDPQIADIHLNLARTLYQKGDFEESKQSAQKALELNPDWIEPYRILAYLFQQTAELVQSEEMCVRAMQINPEDSEIYKIYGQVLSFQGRMQEAEEKLRRALRFNPDNTDIYLELGYVLFKEGKLEEVEFKLKKVLELTPENVDAYNQLGLVERSTGRLKEALQNFEKTLNISPRNEAARSNLLFTMNYLPGMSASRLRDAHEKWCEDLAARHSPLVKGLFQTGEKFELPLRIGFVSGDFGKHPVGFFVYKLFHYHDRDKFRFYSYSQRPVQDELTAMFRECSEVWVEARGLEEENLCQRIQNDQIDVLFDLSGHTEHNRLSVFARRPAPVQITWAGYVGTIGLPTMDYLLADYVHVPPGHEDAYREEVLRMPAGFGYVPYAPPDYALDVGPLPAKTNGYVTFAVFQNPAKINDYVLALWAKIMRSVPGACLLLHYSGMDSNYNVSRIENALQECGVDSQRILCRGKLPHHELLASYNQVDITLDTHPYSGGLTTCESLWMGVPVVTLRGETFASRHSASHLTQVGLRELIAGGEEEYVSIAVDLATDQERLSELRASLRERMRNSPLFDGESWTRAFEDLILKTLGC